ncbi:MAG: AMP-binding protein, partial [Burkholderiales bacterium]|nr:AMP-binding protein [Burkholderiales bacterium]
YAPDKLAFAPDMIAAIAFTSGSTGDPLPNPKKWGAMAIGGTSEALRFGLVERDSSVIVGTVPPQHMYGLETTLIMPMRSGLIFHHDRPFFPADVRAALASVDADRVLVSTPVHLRALLTSDIDLPRLRMTISATAPLSEEMARQFESRFGVEVQEVYGFTEAGMVATRRTLDGPRWWL